MLNTRSRYSGEASLSSPFMTPTRRTTPSTARDASTNYFSASSADFGLDLFVNGLVHCDSAYNDSSSAACSSSTSVGTSTNASGFFSRCRSNRPLFTASPPTLSGFGSGVSHRQQPSFAASDSVRSEQCRSGAMFSSITSLNRSSLHEHHHHSHQQQTPMFAYNDRSAVFFDISSQKQRMNAANLLSSNLSLATSVALNSVSTIGRPVSVAESNHRPQSQVCLTPPGKIHLAEHLESENVANLSHQQLHALHRFRRQKEKGFLTRLRDVVISFTPKARFSIVNRSDIFVRFGKEEKETLARFDFLDKLPQCSVDTLSLEDDEFGLEVSLVEVCEVVSEWCTANQHNPPNSVGSDSNVTNHHQLSCDTCPTIGSFTGDNTTSVECTGVHQRAKVTLAGVSNKPALDQVEHGSAATDTHSVTANGASTNQWSVVQSPVSKCLSPQTTQSTVLQNVPPQQSQPQQRSNSGKQPKKKWRGNKSKSKQAKQVNKTRQN